MKSLMQLLQCVLEDLGTRCATSTTRDYNTVSRRVEHEGMSFLTISLPNFGSDFQKSLDQGFVAHDQYPGFARAGGLPRFLGGFLELVFDRASGRLLDVPSIEAIFAVRQFSLMCGKIELPCAPERVAKAIDRYIECEKDVRLSDQRLLVSEPDRLERFSRVGRLLWAELFSNVDSRIYNDTVVPKHGPGATADKLRGNAKYNVRLWTSRLESVFPHWEHIIPSESFLKWTDDVTILEPGAEMPVKVITVPKTLKTPRIIAVEPTCMQYMQQGILAVMVEEIASSDNARNLVMFEFQEPNQRLAKEGSLTGALATLDLSDASDRVSNQHVRLLVANHRFLRESVDATRSRKADVPGKGVIRLSKFASMGSALTFPFEALVFATIVFCGIESKLNRRLTQKDVKSFYGRVRVYGDDIIVPVEYVELVIEELEAFGLRVNRNKSFWTGKFRESCGKDYYDGVDVSITRVRRVLPDHRRNADELVSAVSLRNQLYSAGFERAVDFLDNRIRKLIPFPVVEETSVILGRHSFGPCEPESMHKDTQAPTVYGARALPRIPTSRLDGVGALHKFFLVRGDHPMEDKKHLQRAGRAESTRIKLGWAPLR